MLHWLFIGLYAILCYTLSTLEFTMLTVNIRKQGGASVITIPPDVLRTLHIGVGATLSIEFVEGAVTLRPIIKNTRKRYTLAELLQGATPEVVDVLKADTAWSREGEPVGRELS
jgi:antitoxin ChpS